MSRVTVERTSTAPAGDGRRLEDDVGVSYVIGDGVGTASAMFGGTTIHVRGEIASTPYVYLVAFPVPPEDQAEFDEWYMTEHLDLLSRHASWRSCRLVAGEGEDGLTRLALHEWVDTTPQGSPEQAAARATPWRARLAERPWFAGARRLLLHDPGLAQGGLL
jgi:hypothetical protein